MPINRGQVYFVKLGPIVGHEMNSKSRPVVVLSINDVNRKPLVVTVVPGTTRASSFLNVVRIEPSEKNGLRDPTFFQCHHLRAIDHDRFVEPSPGSLSGRELESLRKAVMYTLGFGDNPPHLSSTR